ncbi:MAG TPA: bifunctional UDP-sugar hydrolase/5'-nucleotidase [Longimicrobium sp.]|nr:bifunctional UDP-sugar hydrolase/5'-nucleotidase [Longimicrobium sp.]
MRATALFRRAPRFAAAALLAAAACAPPPSAGPAPAADGVKRVRIVHTNDFHGRLLPERPSWADGRLVGGSAVLAAHFDSAAARFGGPTLVISAGDDMQGTAISNLSWGRSTIAAHNASGYLAAALGNHEFDWGLDTLRARVAESRFPWLAANLTETATGRAPSWLRPWVMLDRGGVRTAVIGAALPGTPEIVMAGRVRGLAFGPAAPAIDAAAREARAAGADFVVVTMHIGAVCETPGGEGEAASAGCEGEMMDVAEAITEPVDLILGGHTHQRVLATAGGIPVVEARSYSTAYSVTDLERRGGRTSVVYRAVRTPWADEVDPDTAVARVVGEWEARVRPVSERVMVTFAEPMERGRGETALGNLLADAVRAATGADATLINNGSIRRDMPAGPITYGTLYELQPFQNELVRLEVTGAQLRAALENALSGDTPDAHLSGMTVTYDPAAPAGSRVRSVRLAGGREVGDADRVTLGLSEFIATGGDRYTSFLEGRMTRTGQVDLEAAVAYLQSLPQPVRAPETGRWRTVR